MNDMTMPKSSKDFAMDDQGLSELDARCAPMAEATSTTAANSASGSSAIPEKSRGDVSTRGAKPTKEGSGFGAPKREPALSMLAIEQLENRGLDVEIATRLGFVSASVRGRDGWIGIPFLHNGEPTQWTYRTVDKPADGSLGFHAEKGSNPALWNADVVTDPSLRNHPLIIAEGIFDALSAIQSGYVRTVSMNGASVPGGDSWVTELLDDLGKQETVILAADGDEAGRKAMHELATRLGRGRCKYLAYPDGCKDLNDVVRNRGQSAVGEVVSTAKWMHVAGVFRMSELPPMDYPQPHEIGMGQLDEHYRIRRGDFCVITGVPGYGKTTFVNDVACRMALNHGWATTFASFEQNPQLDHKRALVRWWGGIPAAVRAKQNLTNAAEWIDDNFGFVVPGEDDEATLDWLLEKIASTVVRYGAKMAVIDPWNEMDHDKPPQQTMTEYVGLAIRRLKKFARQFDIHLIVVAHPAKMAKTKDGKQSMPNLYDISDSAHWANKPDVALVVHKDDFGDSLIRIIKSRYHDQIGKPGTVPFYFNEHLARFECKAGVPS